MEQLQQVQKTIEEMQQLAEELKADINDQMGLSLTGPASAWRATQNWRDSLIQRMVERRSTPEKIKQFPKIQALYFEEWLAVKEQLAHIGVEEN